ncbi:GLYCOSYLTRANSFERASE-RELATED [Salix koriyanagi]|uniref:Glycosyltransferase n=1 Tax=Salix koriyanagi TaxID=2511006 RepID=A0A9Q0Z0F7_9ROSI|nr:GLYCOSYLTRANSFERASE-RELATED [Salix koriyanagi]
MEILSENKEEEIHVLMVALSSQGHINPMLRLGKRLVNKGLHVTLATTEFTRRRMLKSSTINPTASSISISGVQVRFFSDGQNLDYDGKVNVDSYMENLANFGAISLSNLIKEHFPNPEMSVELPGLPLLRAEDLPSYFLPSNPFGSLPKLLSDMFQNMKKYKWVLGNSFFGLERDAIESMADLCPISPIGPLVPPSLLGEDEDHDSGTVEMWKRDDTCIEWLNKEAPSSVIYVSFGSISVLSAKQMECIAKALKNSSRPFIWAVKQPSLPEPDGAGQLPLGFLEETKDQGLVVSWSPQTKVLAHPAIACFITHCGWNSMLETIAAGVPVIAYPQWTDQPTNAKLIADIFRNGLRLRANQDGIVSNEEVEKCIREIMDGPKSVELKSNARELRVAAREAVAGAGSSDKNIQLFVDEIIRSCGSIVKGSCNDTS